MAIGYGTVAMSTINSELGRSSTAGISLDAAENGSYVCINQFSGARPNSGNPASISEWKGYDHGYRPSANSTYGYDYYYTYCANSYGTTAVVRVIVAYIYDIPNDPCYGSYYAYYAYSYEYVAYYYYDSGCYSGGGCMNVGTKVTMADGSLKNIEDIEVGDIVLSANINDLPDERPAYFSLEIVKNWRNPDISDFEFGTATVITKNVIQTDQFYSINEGLIEMSTTHYHLYKDVLDGQWKFGQSPSLKVGDQIIDINKNIITIESISIIQEPTTVIELNIESEDLFFANGVLTHNVPKNQEI
jgi:hypothetical protein